jgi:hypothetical protein
MPTLTYTVARGRRAGVVLTPHLFADGFYRAHMTNSRNDPEGRRVKSIGELIELVCAGYHVRMSNLAAGHAPSTVKPEVA